MANPAYNKRRVDPPIWTGPRVAEEWELGIYDLDLQFKIEKILEAMDWPHVIIFQYGESDRVVAPFVIGVSSEGNPLMRGYQLEGNSRSGKGEGWRIFQVNKMLSVDTHQDFFYIEDFDFDRWYPWIYKVYKML
jgi:hypothetical protein